MKTSQKLLLAAIIVGTAVGVNLIYSLVTYIGKERSLGEEHTYTLRAERGRIFDADGNILARTDTLYDIGLDCTIIRDEVWENLSPMLAGQLAGLFSQRDSTDWQQRLDQSRADKNRYLVIANGVSKEKANAVRSFPIFDLGQYRGGGIVKPRYIRAYPFGMLGRSTIGDIRREPVKPGLEVDYNAALTGVDGRQKIRYGRYLGRDVRKVTENVPAINGQDIHTTLRMPIMSVADSVLRAAIAADKDVDSGCLVVMEVCTGAIQCVVNLTKTSDGIFELNNLAANCVYEPQGLAQAMTYAALLSDGFISSMVDTVSTNQGNYMYSHHPDKRIQNYGQTYHTQAITIRDAWDISSISVPSNLVYASYANEPERFTNHLGEYCPEFENVKKGWITSHVSSRDLPALAYGCAQGTSPLSILAFYNSIANKGMMMAPHIVEYMSSGAECIERDYAVGQVMSSSVADTLISTLRYMTQDGPRTTGERWKADLIGKSSISKMHQEGNGERYATTFVSFFPSDDPAISMITVLFGGTKNLYLPAKITSEFVTRYDYGYEED